MQTEGVNGKKEEAFKAALQKEYLDVIHDPLDNILIAESRWKCLMEWMLETPWTTLGNLLSSQGEGETWSFGG